MSEATVQAPEINFSIFKNLTIVFLVLNAGFLYLIYATFMGVDIGLFNITEFAAHANAHVMLHIHALAAILGGSYVFMITKHYGVSLTLAVLPQFAFIGALGGVLLQQQQLIDPNRAMAQAFPMKLQYRQIESFVKAPDKAARVILVYGPDTGLVSERCAIIGKTVVQDLHDPFNVAVLSGDMVEDDPARLSDEAGAISMMGGDRLIRIERGGDKLTVTIKEYLEAPSDNALVVIQAGDLGPRSSLRKLCESAKNAAAVPCYVEDERDVANVIRQTAQEERKSIDREAVSWLAANISGDRARVRSELEKLMIYKGEENTPISMADAIACCGGASQQGLDNLTNATAGRNAEAALKAYGVLAQEGVAFIVILRSLQNHFRRLHMTRAYMQSGMDMDSAMKKLSPPVFFKQAPQFKGQVNGWSLSALDNIMGKLTDLEAQCKTTGVPVDTLCSQAILAISKTRAG